MAAALQSPLALKITQTPAPIEPGPPALPTAPVFLTAARGFVAGLAVAPTPGRPDRAVIDRTTDSGRTWTPIWKSTLPGLTFTFLGRSRGPRTLLYAAGEIGAGPVGGRPVLVVSTDGGKTWTVLRPALPSTPVAHPAVAGPGAAPPLAQADWSDLQFQFLSAAVGFAGFNPAYSDASYDDNAPLVLVTHDGGRNWTPLPLPSGLAGFSGGLDFTSPTDGWITGFAGTVRRCNRLWHTINGGAAWSASTGCLSFPLRAVDFVDATHGFAAGGNRFHGNPPFEAVLATADGGQRWRTVSTPVAGRPIVQLAFSGPTSGFAVTGTASIGGNGRGVAAVLRTTDGGRTWTHVAAGARVASVGSQTAWTSVPSDNALMATADGGSTWDVVAQVGSLSFGGVFFLHGNGQTGWLQAGPALFATADGGRTWSPYPPSPSPYPPGFPVFASRRTAFALGPAGRLLRTADGGRTWSAVPAVSGALGVNSVTFTDAAHGWAAVGTSTGFDALVATTDGGTTWHAAATLPVSDARLAFGRRLWVATGWVATGTRPRTAVAVSTDRGAAWRTLDLPKTVSCHIPSVAGDSILLACNRFSTTAPGGAVGIILRSSDGGRRWQAYGTGRVLPRFISLTGRQEGWMTAGLLNGAAGLYRTTDGGLTWTQVWPTLPLPPLHAAAASSAPALPSAG